MKISYQPIPAWPDPDTKPRKPSAFKATPARTREVLEQEARALRASDLVVELVGPKDLFYVDGTGIRSDRRPLHPGVVVRMIGTRHGDLRYATDAFFRWEDNYRAVALGLESLRRVERYGIATRGEQYVGWQALPPGTPMGSTHVAPAMDLATAAAVLAGGTDGVVTSADVLGDAEDARAAYRLTAKRYHPDRGGSDEVMAKVNEAWGLVAAHHQVAA